MAVMSSVFIATRRAESNERIKNIKQRAEHLREQTEEEIKSPEERAMLHSNMTSMEEEVKRLKKTSWRLRNYDWEPELESDSRDTLETND